MNNERKITVSQYNGKPMIKINANWLGIYGFFASSKVKVTCSEGKLVLERVG